VTNATVARTGLSIAPNFGSENLLKWLVETCERPCGRAADERDEHAPVHCPVPPVLSTERIAHLVRQETAALRDFGLAYDRSE
jgi:hypothetical protein